MKTPDIPVDEIHRLEALRALNLLDTDPDPKFDHITLLASALFKTDICMISIIDAERQWFKSSIGMETSETPRDISFCGHAIVQKDVLVILDASLDDRFIDNPLVTGPPHIRFYAGAQIRLPQGYTIGTVCIISKEPKPHFSEEKKRQLAAFAELVVQILAAQEMRSELDRARADTDRLRVAIEEIQWPIALIDPSGQIECSSAAFDELRSKLPDISNCGTTVPVEWIRELAAEVATEKRISIAGADMDLQIRPDIGGYLVTGICR